MATKTPRIRNAGGQGRVCVFRVILDMTGQAATTAIPHYVVTVLGLRLTDVATGTLFAQHRVRNAVPERLQIVSALWPGRSIEYLPRNLNHTARHMHQVCCYRRDSFGVAVAAGTRGVVQFARKSDQSLVCIVLER